MRLGFIGLGIMAAPWRPTLLKAKWEVAVHDVRPEAAGALLAMGADWADSPAADGRTL